MRPTLMLAIGLLAVSLPAFLSSCAMSGPKAPPVVHDTQLIDTPVKQYVATPTTLTAHPYLAPLPSPAYWDGPCAVFGCYSNAQLREALSQALASRAKCIGQLDQIGGLSNTAVQSNPH